MKSSIKTEQKNTNTHIFSNPNIIDIIKIKHNSTYQTAYGHLSKFAKRTRVGNRVKQGQIIGFVGNTGRSTGPHLHYEVIRKGRKINPRSVRIPSGEKLKGSELKKFLVFRNTTNKKFSNLFKPNQNFTK